MKTFGRRTGSLLAGTLFTLLAAGPQAHAATTIVDLDGGDDIYLAGAAPGTTLGGDSLAANAPVLALTLFDVGSPITFSVVGGFSHVSSGAMTADGRTGTDYNYGDALGIAGRPHGPLGALIGVFLDDTTPGGTAPARRDDGTVFTTLSPLLNQSFFIGDGLTGTGTGSVQTFYAPVGATRLFLGASDAPGGNYDNSGTATVTISYGPLISGAVPEPATWALMIGGFGLVGGSLRRRTSRACPA